MSHTEPYVPVQEVRWVESARHCKIGKAYFLVQFENESNGKSSWALSSFPMKAEAGDQVFIGFIKKMVPHMAIHAEGMGRLLKLDGDRGLVEILRGPELCSALKEAGYPELGT